MSVRNGRPSKSYLDTLQKPSEAEWRALETAAISAIVQNEKDVLVAFSYVFKYPDDFPKGVLYEKQDWVDIRRVKAVKLLAWMNKHGLSEITPRQVQHQLRDFGRWQASFMETLDNEDELTDNDSFNDTEETDASIHP